MQVAGAWLDQAQPVLRSLSEAGYQALVVGGCVRNSLMGVPVTDVDISTDARPEQVMALAERDGMRAVPTGLPHGTVTLVHEGHGYEVTTFRRDVETHGRHATIAFSGNIAEDAARRDFTINALYARPDGTVIDPLGGRPDIAARRVRFVGDARARIAEDYLRILRFFRFHAQYGDPFGGVDAEALAACAESAHGLDTLSAERIGGEMRRLLAAPDPAPSVAAMAQTGVLPRILPGADPEALARLVHLDRAFAPEALRRLLTLGGETARLRLTRREAEALVKGRAALAAMTGPAELGYRLGAELARDVMLSRAALLETPLPEGWQQAIQRGADAQFPLRARDLPHLDGPALGLALKALEERWVASDFRLSRDELLA
ncbi:MAG: CCA tRNA nucleotidyltransferase [Rhodobacteraceae bacterium]|nr:MAG: CCA tRNA nucleotidyltransferase [Paracoccaceae bacterium]